MLKTCRHIKAMDKTLEYHTFYIASIEGKPANVLTVVQDFDSL